MDPDRPITYSVQVWSIEKYVGSRTTTYKVRWKAASRRWKKSFRTSALADSYRSALITAVRNGEAFDVETGQPISLIRHSQSTMSWYEFACKYVDMKWPTTSPNHRRGTANVLMSATTALLSDQMPADKAAAQAIRSALYNWGLTARRGSGDQPADVTAHLEWVARNSPALIRLADARVIRSVLSSLATKLDGSRASGRTAVWRRSVLSTALNYAVELKLLPVNPVPSARWSAPRATEAVDRRSVVNPSKARALLAAVAELPRSGGRMAAFFGAMYYSALRPEEAVNLRRANLDLPAEGWGWITLDQAAPEVARQWSDTDRLRETRELKHRAPGESRRVPCPPALTKLLHAHMCQRRPKMDPARATFENGPPYGVGVRWSGGGGDRRAGEWPVLDSVGVAVEGDDVAVVDEPVDDRGSDDVVSAEDLTPPAERLVRGHDGRGGLVAGRDQVEDQARGLALDRDVADLVDDQQRDPRQPVQLGLEVAAVVCSGQSHYPVRGSGEGDLVPTLGGADA